MDTLLTEDSICAEFLMNTEDRFRVRVVVFRCSGGGGGVRDECRCSTFRIASVV